MSSTIVAGEILKAVSDATADAVEKVAPSVVAVSSGMGRGSGVVWTSDGYILTARHVVGKSSEVRVSLAEGSNLEAKVVGVDPYSDVALLKIEGARLKPTELGDSENLRIGQFVLALANPFSRRPSATFGIITSVGGGSFREWAHTRGVPMENVILTDARLNPGYSGGPLVDASGKMIGLNTAHVWGRGVAVAVNKLKDIADKLSREGKIERAYLGVVLHEINLPEEIASQEQINQNAGVMALSVEANSPAKNAGLALGDIIIKLDGKPVTSIYELHKLLAEEVIGKETKLLILRGEKPTTLTITPKAAKEENL